MNSVGLSWLIGSSLAEILTSIIFLFVKHPYDVGDRIRLDKEIYIVKEIRLLSTILLDSNSCLVQAPNTSLNAVVRASHVFSRGSRSPLNHILVHLQHAPKSASMIACPFYLLSPLITGFRCLSPSRSMWYVHTRQGCDSYFTIS